MFNNYLWRKTNWNSWSWCILESLWTI